MCNNLRSFVVKRNNQDNSFLHTIGAYAFYGTFKLSSQSIQVSISNEVNTIGIGAFYGCTGMTYVSGFSSGQSELTQIGDFAFSGSGITQFYIPHKITSIGVGAFLNCYNLNTVYIDHTTSTTFQVLTDSSSSPSSIVTQALAQSANYILTVSFIVLNNNYYEITSSASGLVVAWTEWY